MRWNPMPTLRQKQNPSTVLEFLRREKQRSVALAVFQWDDAVR